MRELILKALDERFPKTSYKDPEVLYDPAHMSDEDLLELLIDRVHTAGYRKCMSDYPDNSYI
jgi:hypothetical protein